MIRSNGTHSILYKRRGLGFVYTLLTNNFKNAFFSLPGNVHISTEIHNDRGEYIISLLGVKVILLLKRHQNCWRVDIVKFYFHSLWKSRFNLDNTHCQHLRNTGNNNTIVLLEPVKENIYKSGGKCPWVRISMFIKKPRGRINTDTLQISLQMAKNNKSPDKNHGAIKFAVPGCWSDFFNSLDLSNVLTWNVLVRLFIEKKILHWQL